MTQCPHCGGSFRAVSAPGAVRETLKRELHISSDHDHRSWDDIECAFAALAALATPEEASTAASGGKTLAEDCICNEAERKSCPVCVVPSTIQTDGMGERLAAQADALMAAWNEIVECSKRPGMVEAAPGLTLAASMIERRRQRTSEAYANRPAPPANAAGQLEPFAWVAIHSDKGVNFNTFAETQQGAASLLMRTGIAGNHGWSIEPVYRVAPPAAQTDGLRELLAAEFAKSFPAVLAQYSQYKIVDWFLDQISNAAINPVEGASIL